MRTDLGMARLNACAAGGNARIHIDDINKKHSFAKESGYT